MKFQPGKTYETRSIGDYDCIIRATILHRTTKTVVAHINGESEPKRFRVSEYEGNEQFRPWGNYSMAPIIGADDVCA